MVSMVSALNGLEDHKGEGSRSFKNKISKENKGNNDDIDNEGGLQ